MMAGLASSFPRMSSGAKDRSSFQKVSESPTNPRSSDRARDFDVADLYRGPLGEVTAASAAATLAPPDVALDEKLRQAYLWIVNEAIISPFYDIEYHDGPSQTFTVGDSKTRLTLPSGHSYSSF